MNSIDVQQLIRRSAELEVIHPNQLTLSNWAIAQFINTAVEIIEQEDIEGLLDLTTNLTKLPTSDDAITITIGICEQLMTIDNHLVRWFLDTLLRDAPQALRSDIEAALQYELANRSHCFY